MKSHQHDSQDEHPVSFQRGLNPGLINEGLNEPWDEVYFPKKTPKNYDSVLKDYIDKNLKDRLINNPGGQPALQRTPTVEELKGEVYTLNVLCSLNLL